MMTLHGLTTERGSRLGRWVFASFALHAAVLAALLVHRADVLTKVDRPGDALGHLVTVTYTPGGAPTVAALATVKHAAPAFAPLPRLNTRTLAPPAPAQPATASAHDGSETGFATDSLGDGDIRIALTVNHPDPQPDLSALPHGTHGDVVVDVVIDSAGHIVQWKLVRGLGSPVDGSVLATVQQWTFTPATRDGQPIASEQELLFHYDHA